MEKKWVKLMSVSRVERVEVQLLRACKKAVGSFGP